MRQSVLVCDDDELVAGPLVDWLEHHGYQVQYESSGESALGRLGETAYDVLVTDLRLPGVDGLAVMREALALYPELAVILITGFASVETAVQAIKLGAADYLTKPFKPVQLSLAIEKALRHRGLAEENRSLRRQLEERYQFDNIVGRSEAMRRVYSRIETVAPTDSTVLITGESGTGKELVAKSIHYNSRRKDFPLVCVNCGAIPETLIEDELFGHVRGAFTGADRPRPGHFEQADRGTLLLDEIGTLPLHLQVKLLRVLQERRFQRLGGTETIEVDVRILAATSADLAAAVREHRFREDLFYRLNVIPIQLPSLRQRSGDIPLLVHHFLSKLCSRQKKADKRISQALLQELMNYDWPGNVREMENSIEHAVTLSGDRVLLEPEDFPARVLRRGSARLSGDIELPEDGLSLNELIGKIERGLILMSLERTGGNKKRAAELLGLKRTTLLEKIKKNQIALSG
ncbi:MAG TPA: sigma-54 dependent transcriptional regulator [Acidobacteriota bacterium]